MQTGRIGPNAVTRLAEALTQRRGEAATLAVFTAAGQAHLLTHPPHEMVDEMAVARLHQALVITHGPQDAALTGQLAGLLVGDYLLAHRIPPLAQRLLRLLPRRLAAAILVRAVARHAWTFAGSGQFAYGFDDGLHLTLAHGPVARLLSTGQPACHFYRATFQRVFAAMLGPQVRVAETACESAGAPACRFHLTWHDAA